ncbi:hypothetical protein ACFX2I_009433 [Malus domestica]
MQMMKALLTHPTIVLIISIDQHFHNYKHGVYVPSLDEPCEAHTHAVTLLGTEARAVNAYEGARYEAETIKAGEHLILIVNAKVVGS